jgi:23S rRNA-/tRNA-specific pseudouridylate synthase
MTGYPIAGDKKYGAHTDPAKRLCLHARYLEFTHPITGKVMTFESPLPAVFSKIIPET